MRQGKKKKTYINDIKNKENQSIHREDHSFKNTEDAMNTFNLIHLKFQ